jgi:hypothetical protein
MSQTFAEYLDGYRAKATVTATPALTNAEVLALVKDEDIRQHGAFVLYQFIGDDGASGDATKPPVYRLGTQVLLQDVKTQLDALVAAGSISKVPGANTAYSANPSLRK